MFLGNQKQGKVYGIGTLEIKFRDGANNALQEVTYVTLFKKKSISLSMLGNARLEFKGHGRELKVTRSSMVYLRGDKRNEIYFLRSAIEISLVNAVMKGDKYSIKLWHKRLFDINEIGLQKLNK